MSDTLKIFPIPPHTEKWYQFRTKGIPEWEGGIGASEASKFFSDIPQYQPSLMEMFHDKVGSHTPPVFDNEAAFWGRYLEPSFLLLWQFWDNTPDGYIKRYMEYEAGSGQKVRTHRPVGGYVVNPKYPWLFATPDSIIPAGEKTLYGTILKKDCPLECKALGHWQHKRGGDYRDNEENSPDFLKSDGGVSPAYECQMQHQQIVMGVEYGEFAYGVENKRFVVEAHDKDAERQEAIIDRTHDFWHYKVLPARGFYAEALRLADGGDQSGAEDMMAHVMNLEPDPFGNKAEDAFLAETHAPEEESAMNGGILMFQTAREHRGLQQVIGKLEKMREQLKLVIKTNHKKGNVVKLDFGDYGYTKFDGRNFKNQLKNIPQLEEKVAKTLSDLNLDKFK